MSALFSKDPVNLHKIPALTLEELLTELTRYGRPRVSCMSDMRWHASIEMNTNNTPGASFEIRSEFKCSTPTDAAKQCLERVINALRQAG